MKCDIARTVVAGASKFARRHSRTLYTMEKIRSHERRDRLLAIEGEVQLRWEQGKVFEVDAPSSNAEEGEKFFGNFPYPYMNGLLHIGHAFSASKLEFAAAYHRLRGKNVLFPFGFHCTGMPIKACADKIQREITKYGNPPIFPSGEEVAPIPTAPVQSGDAKAEPEKGKSKKSKAAAKTGGAKYQWEIMQSLGLPDDEIANFRDPSYWLTYFPPLAMEDLKALGLGVDWRRSFITTDYNPFYDSFVSWHMETLKEQGRDIAAIFVYRVFQDASSFRVIESIVKDLRYAVYSPLDGQPCADHDRASGEGVQPQDYTLIKMQVNPPFQGQLAALHGRNVYLAAATLRPETMYGQTNAWVLPEGQYGAYEINEKDVFIITERAALNLAYQKLSKVAEKPSCLLQLKGQDLIGLPLSSPLTSHPIIYALPMLTILTDKGTGIVTSVPSDAPDDFMALKDLKSKKGLREKYGVKDEWVLPFDLIPIINIPDFGDKAAEKTCNDLNIKSQNDKEKLAEAKRLTYLKGFTEGTMLIGEYNGAKVSDVKPLIKKMLLETGQAVVYSEPEKKVMSRSGDECVVALTDQWYLTYGEAKWRSMAEECLKRMKLYHDETRNGFEHTLGWLNQWACSRSFGLGTRLPWDKQYLVESLSDSTVYMAYYAVAHILQKMKQEFEYWYPFDLRVSGKDLIQNHLTFSIYNHTAIFPKERWPLAFRCNGHIMLNSEKMSKSTGNFMTLRQSIEEFSADATRFALADAGDTMDDANYVSETANSAILRLTKEITWMEEDIIPSLETLRSSERMYADQVFDNEINIAVDLTEKNYNSLSFRDALKTGFYDLQRARDEYRLSCGIEGMHKDLLQRFMHVQTKLLTPICPHYAEHVWTHILKQEGFAVKGGWPDAEKPDYTLQRANQYLQNVIVDLRKVLQKQTAPPKKARKDQPLPEALRPTDAIIFVAERYGGWQEECLQILRSLYDKKSCTFKSDAEILAALKDSPTGQTAEFKRIMSQCMPFIKYKKDETRTVGPEALDLKLPFGEATVLNKNKNFIARQLGLSSIEVRQFNNNVVHQLAAAHQALLKQSSPSPGKPAAVFLTASELAEVAGRIENLGLQ